MSEVFSLALLHDEVARLSIGDQKPPVILVSDKGFQMLWQRLADKHRRIYFSADGISVAVELSDRLMFDGIPVLQVTWPPDKDRQFFIVPVLGVSNGAAQ